MKKRNLFAELADRFYALAEEREGKRTLRTNPRAQYVTRAGHHEEAPA